MRVYYSLAVWRFKPIFSAGLRFHSHSSSGLPLRNYRAVAGNHKFSSRFSVFACFCDGYSNRVKRLRRLSGNFILLKASLFSKRLPFSVCVSGHVGRGGEVIDIRSGFKASKGSRMHVERWRTMWRMSLLS